MNRRTAPLLLLALACKSGPPGPPTPIEARVTRIFPRTTSMQASTLDVKVSVENPRATPVGLASVRYALETGDVAGTIEGSLDLEGQLLAEQRAEVGFVVDIPLPTDTERLTALIGAEMVPADLSGEIRFDDGSAARFERKASLATPRLPRFEVLDAQAAQYDRERLDLTMFLRLTNENAFTVVVRAVDYTLEVAGQQMRAEQVGVGARITAGSAEEYEISLRLEAGSSKQLPEVLASGIVPYRIFGEVKLPQISVPFEHTSQVDLGAVD